MAMTELVIWPRAKSLRYASGMFAELRVIFEDLERAAHDPARVKQIAKRGRGRAISAKATMDNATDDAVAEAIAEAVANHRERDDVE